MESTLDAALTYAALGWPVLVLRAGQKTPATPRGFKDATTDADVIRGWFEALPDANVGIRTGAASGLVVLDVDVKNGQPGRESHAALKLPATPISQTPSGGWHCLFRHPGSPVSCRAGIRPGLDIRADGGYIVAPPSRCEDGFYRWQLGPEDEDIAPIPASLKALLGGPPAQASQLGAATPGRRNDHLTRFAGLLRGQGMGRAAVEAALHAANLEQCKPPLPDTEVRKIAASVARYPAQEVGLDFPAPETLPPALPAVDGYTDELLPGGLAGFVRDVADRMQCPPDFPAVALLVMCGSLVGRQVGIRPKARDDWTVTPNLWGAIIGRPGVMKTPAMQEALRPVHALENLERDEHEAARMQYETLQLEAKARRQVAQETFRKALKSDPQARLEPVPDPESPVRKRYVVFDTTVEKLGELLQENPNGLLLVRDEFSGFLRNLDRQGREADRAFYLETWNGDGRFTYDRIGRGTVDIDSCCLSIIGTIQPGPFLQYVRGGRTNGALDDGLLQRFQLAVWPDDPGVFRDIDREPDARALQDIRTIVNRLVSIPTGELTKGPEGAYVSFDSEAQGRFRSWRGDLENRLRTGDEHPALESHLSKYRSLVPSLALIFHLIERRRGSALVTLDSLNRAIAWVKYLESHARRTYAPLIGGDIDAARLLAAHIRKGHLGSEFAARSVYRHGWAGLSDAEVVKSALTVLEDYGWVFARQVATPGRPRLTYMVNPRIRAGTDPT